MKRRRAAAAWARVLARQFSAATRLATAAGRRVLAETLKGATPSRPVPTPKARSKTAPTSKSRPRPRAPATGAGTWTPGVALGASGARRFRLFSPPGIRPGERLPLMVMLHGCGQDADGFAASTRMNRVAVRERFLVLYPEQDRLANPQACWNWFGTDSGRAQGEVGLILRAIDQVCLQHPADRTRVAVAGLSAGASMAALLAARHPDRFQVLVMHSGVPPGVAHSTLSALRAMRGTSPTPAALPADAWPGPTRDVPPLMVIHGTADGVVSARNGHVAAEFWARAAGARAGPARTVARGRRYPMSITDYRRPGGAVAATLVLVQGLAHGWSGGAAGQAHGDVRGPDASRLAWAFAARQFRLASARDVARDVADAATGATGATGAPRAPGPGDASRTSRPRRAQDSRRLMALAGTRMAGGG